MKNYQELLQLILDTGVRQSNRTGIDTLTLPGAMLKFDLREGFPAVTTKKLAFDAVKGELIGFLRGATSAADFRALGCNVWNKNANENAAWLDNDHRSGEDDLGRIYSAQWRNWRPHNGESVYEIDQIAVALHTLRTNPESRRIIVNAWNPAELDQAALPPCHVLFQLLPHVDSKVLHMTMYQRSCDMFLGVPFNIASYALLLSMFAAWSGYTPGTLTMFLADAHIYVNHLEQVQEQLARKPLPLPRLKMDILGTNIGTGIDFETYFCSDVPLQQLLDDLDPEDIWLHGYLSHPAIKAPMAV